MSETPTVLTIGHSNHAWERFLELAQANEVACILDVRSIPASRRFPQFNRDAFEHGLKEAGIGYRFLGDRLGGRPKDTICYAGGAVDYARVAATQAFRDGLDEAASLARERRCCLLCAEKDPLDCHRSILVARHLAPKGFSLVHIHGDGRQEAQNEFEKRLVETDEDAPLLAAVEDARALLQLAYNRRGRRMAFRA
ncbi:MAG: DUF488 domain-containing protein [Alphaproteobacteria bacterium]|nr:DUF488 domain-containing protein [Alphaproteobacteria bacterium]